MRNIQIPKDVIYARIAAIAAENRKAIEWSARQVVARSLVLEFVRGNNCVKAELQLALVQQRQSRRVEEKRGSILGARGSAGKGDPEPADTLFA